jgi:hypothetical protein
MAPNDTNNASDVFVRDLQQSMTWLISLNAAGTASGNGASSKPILAADGRTVAFQSFASDLVEGDFNDRRDVFVVRLGDADTGGEGLRILTLTFLTGGARKILWSATPGQMYRVQFKNSLTDAGWNDVAGTITANGTTACQADGNGVLGDQRFYRVQLVR